MGNLYKEVGVSTNLSTEYVLKKAYKKLYNVEKIPEELGHIFMGDGYFLDSVPYVDFVEHFGISNSTNALKFVLNPDNMDAINEYVEWYNNRKNRER